jgi:hypothetical protein
MCCSCELVTTSRGGGDADSLASGATVVADVGKLGRDVGVGIVSLVADTLVGGFGTGVGVTVL